MAKTFKYHKLCKCCGKPFDTNSPQKLFCDREHYLPCPICGKPVKKTDRDFTRPPKCCSSECTHKLRQMHFKPKKCAYCGEWFIPKSGVQIVCEKTHYKNCEICGKPFVRTPSTEDNGITTCSRKCELEKMRRNSLKKYGTEHPMQSYIVQKHFHDAMEEKYGVRHALQIPESKASAKYNLKKTMQDHYGVDWPCFTPNSMSAHTSVISTLNKKFKTRLENYGINNITMEKVIEGKRSYDLCLEDQKILIEIDPTYTHSTYENANHWHSSVSQDYHLEKTKLANDHGYRVIHIFDWDNKEKIIQSLMPKKRVYARQCEIYMLKPSVARKFTAKYHLQGSCRGQAFCLGLVKDDELLEVMTFGNPRYNKKYDYELLRLCTKFGYEVIGGASKLFSFATKYFEISNIISYCDYSKFNGLVYSRMGMTLSKITPPQEVWSRDKQFVSANLLRERGYDQLFGKDYGKGASNELLMLINGWLPVFDCGQKVFEYKIDE